MLNPEFKKENLDCVIIKGKNHTNTHSTSGFFQLFVINFIGFSR